jgi:hypothetical protein
MPTHGRLAAREGPRQRSFIRRLLREHEACACTAVVFESTRAHRAGNRCAVLKPDGQVQCDCSANRETRALSRDLRLEDRRVRCRVRGSANAVPGSCCRLAGAAAEMPPESLGCLLWRERKEARSRGLPRGRRRRRRRRHCDASAHSGCRAVHCLISKRSRAMCACTNWTTAAPSPTAVAQRLIEPARTSPAA